MTIISSDSHAIRDAYPHLGKRGHVYKGYGGLTSTEQEISTVS